jgi:hypothetical protein
VPDHKPLVAGDSKTSAPKDGTKVAAQSTPTTPPPAPSGYHYEIFPLSPNSPASFKGKEGVRLVPNADNFGPLPNASSTNATVDKLNPGLSGLPVRAPSTFPDPAKANPVRGNSATASERDDILDRVRAQVTATSERLKLFGVTEKMITDGAVACGISGAAGCAGYAAAEYIHKLGHENDRLAAEANAISSKDPNAQAKLDRIYGRLGAIDRRIGQIETTVVVGRDGAIGCVTGGPAGCVLGASESAAWLTAEKYAPPGYAEKIRTAKAIRDVGGILYKGVKGGTEGFPLPNGETVKGFEGTALALSKETAIKALKEATQFEGAQTGKSAPTATPAPNGTSASTDKSQPEGKSQSAGKSQLTEKSQLTANPQPSEKPQPAAKYVHPTVTEFQQPRVIQAAFRQPGGISLTKAAAERMALNIDIDAITYRNGQIIIAGAQNAANKIDAALFLTAMRLACTPGDPFFSLDPVDGRAWQEQSRAAMDAAWKQVESSIKARLRSPFDVKTFSVQRDFAAVWAKMGSQYPELRAELVFRPEWLRETRFGEILYKADVLLKELTVGIPVVTPGGPARMADIPGYIAPYKRGAARGLLVSKQTERQGWQGHRLWFDLMSQAGPDGPPAYEDPDASIDRNSNRALYATLKQRGFVDPPRPQPLQESRLYVENGIADISGVFPKMFILKHDAATGRDVPGASPDLDLLSADVNKRTALYASAYQELRDLTGIFRAYIASTKIVKEEPDVCAKLPDELTGGERVPSAMPEFHPSELFITAAYAVGSSAYQYSTSSSVSGGISLRGKQYYQQAVIEKETPLIAEIKRDLSAGVPLPEFKSTSGRQYLAFDTRELPRKIPIAAQ